MNKVPKNGDIFKFPITDLEFGFGRVLLNIESLFSNADLIHADNPIRAYKNQQIMLAEFFSETTSGELPAKKSVLISGILTTYGFIDMGLWSIVGNQPVDPTKVDFPEGLASTSPVKTSFVKGELAVPFDMELSEMNEIGFSPVTHPPTIFANVMLYHLGRKDEITDSRIKDKEIMNMNRYDLRFSDFRLEIYKRAGIDPDESYYEMSKRMGFDLARFYK